MRIPRICSFAMLLAVHLLSGCRSAERTLPRQDPADPADDPASDEPPDCAEICDGIDNDGDGQIDNGLGSCGPEFVDGDEDGFTPCGGDCDDANAAVSPDAAETCDAVDSDCDGSPAPGDTDGDSYSDCEDCSPLDPTIFPGAPELPYTWVDEDCDGEVDEGLCQSTASAPALLVLGPDEALGTRSVSVSGLEGPVVFAGMYGGYRRIRCCADQPADPDLVQTRVLVEGASNPLLYNVISTVLVDASTLPEAGRAVVAVGVVSSRGDHEAVRDVLLVVDDGTVLDVASATDLLRGDGLLDQEERVGPVAALDMSAADEAEGLFRLWVASDFRLFQMRLRAGVDGVLELVDAAAIGPWPEDAWWGGNTVGDARIVEIEPGCDVSGDGIGDTVVLRAGGGVIVEGFDTRFDVLRGGVGLETAPLWEWRPGALSEPRVAEEPWADAVACLRGVVAFPDQPENGAVVAVASDGWGVLLFNLGVEPPPRDPVTLETSPPGIKYLTIDPSDPWDPCFYMGGKRACSPGDLNGDGRDELLYWSSQQAGLYSGIELEAAVPTTYGALTASWYAPGLVGVGCGRLSERDAGIVPGSVVLGTRSLTTTQFSAVR